MRKEDLPQFCKKVLEIISDKPGGILYSSHETLKHGKVYLLGFNPGGSNGAPISESINNLLSHSGNAYLDEEWSNGAGNWKVGEAPLQKRVVWLLRGLGLNPEEVCSSNLIFMQSVKADDIGFSLAKTCWPVHEAVLSIVKPSIIITFGNGGKSPYSYLKGILGEEEESEISSEHGSWKIRAFNSSIDGRDITIVGLPHLSRYNVIGKESVLSWIRSKV